MRGIVLSRSRIIILEKSWYFYLREITIVLPKIIKRKCWLIHRSKDIFEETITQEKYEWIYFLANQAGRPPPLSLSPLFLSLACACSPRTMNAIRHVVPDKTHPKQCAWRKMEEAEFERTSEKPVKTVLKARRVPRNVAKRIIERTGPSKNCFYDFF